MIDMVRRYPLVSALAILAAVFAVVLAVEYGAGQSLGERVARRNAPAAAPVQAKLLPSIAAVNPDQEYAEIGNRPLFIATRRPAPPAATPATASAMPKGLYTLTGVTIAGGTKIALLREKSSGRVVRVEEGKDVNGITVAQIEPERVTLTQAGDSEVVSMLVSKGAATPAVPAGANPPASGPFTPQPTASPPAAPNPTARAAPAISAPAPGAQPNAPPQPDPNTLFGPRPGGLSPGTYYVPPPDPTTATPPTGQPAAPLTPEELLARRRARRGNEPQQ